MNRDAKLTILFVTHVHTLAERFASHVAQFASGRVSVRQHA